MFSVKSVMTTDVVSVQRNTPVYEALEKLSLHRVSGLPVVDEDMNVVGILSEKDVLKILIDQNANLKESVENYMSTEVISFKEDDSATDVCKFFIKSHIRRVPIVRDNKLVGIISRRDIVNLILDAKRNLDDLRLA